MRAAFLQDRFGLTNPKFKRRNERWGRQLQFCFIAFLPSSEQSFRERLRVTLGRPKPAADWYRTDDWFVRGDAVSAKHFSYELKKVNRMKMGHFCEAGMGWDSQLLV